MASYSYSGTLCDSLRDACFHAVEWCLTGGYDHVITYRDRDRAIDIGVEEVMENLLPIVVYRNDHGEEVTEPYRVEVEEGAGRTPIWDRLEVHLTREEVAELVAAVLDRHAEILAEETDSEHVVMLWMRRPQTERAELDEKAAEE